MSSYPSSSCASSEASSTRPRVSSRSRAGALAGEAFGRSVGRTGRSVGQGGRSDSLETVRTTRERGVEGAKVNGVMGVREGHTVVEHV